jgi:membrane protein implicated in regulation of membrane protease activity
MTPLSSSHERNRLAAGILLLGAVHIALFLRGGNDQATPVKLALSFVATVAVLWLAQRARRRVLSRAHERQSAREAAPTVGAASPPTAPDATSEVPR